MKVLSMLLWVTQFGLSILFPLCFFLMLGAWVQNRFSLGMWVIALFGILGLLITIRTVKVNLRSLRKAAEEAASQDTPPIAFNDHN